MGGGSCGGHPPLLEIVLGTFSGLENINNAPTASTTTITKSAAPETLFTLATSYYASPSLKSRLKLNKDGRVPMEDRKGAFDQFKPRSLLLSTIRITAINISTTMSNFFSDQLHSEQQIESRVDSGEITARDADELNEEWENREWRIRMDALPEKIKYAIARFHANTAVMRLIEFVLARYILKVDGGGANRGSGIAPSSSSSSAATTNNTTKSSMISQEQAVTILDKLTRDTFQASKRTSQLLQNEEHAPGKVISSDGIETSTSRELAKRMFTTCIWANIIPFLAELTVQQGVLIYGYAVYYRAKQRRRKNREQMSEEECKNDDEKKKDDNDDISESAYALSLMFQSSRLSIARYMSWIAASAGGAVGSVIYPGWGTIFGIQIGDAVVGALID